MEQTFETGPLTAAEDTSMVQVKSVSESGEKYSRRGSAAAQDYQTGVEGSSDSDWQQGARDGAGNWAEGVQNAIANNSFENGIDNPSASWQQRTLELGTQRFSGGVQASRSKYETAVGPFFDALESLTLDPRGPRGSEQNFNRSRQVGQRLAEVRQQR